MILTHQLFEFAYGDAMPSETNDTDEEVNWEWNKLKRIIKRQSNQKTILFRDLKLELLTSFLASRRSTRGRFWSLGADGRFLQPVGFCRIN